MNAKRWLVAAAALAAALQIGFLAYVIQGRAAILRHGAEIVLKVEPVDPRDLLRGDYVRLGYDISAVPGDLFASWFPSGARGEPPVWVMLAPGADGFHHAVAAAADRVALPPVREGSVVIAGNAVTLPERDGTVSIAYGIERFYLPEGEGRDIERDMRERSFTMKVAVSESGVAQIKAFFDGDRLLYAEPLY